VNYTNDQIIASSSTKDLILSRGVTVATAKVSPSNCA
jgi:hypothetical protein